MAWARLDDQLDDHDKFLQLSSAAIGQWTLALTYASRKMSDGFISTARAKLQIVGRGEDYDAITSELVTAGLWDVVEGGFQIHDYLDYNPSREQIESKRKADADRKRDGFQTDSARNPNGSASDSDVDSSHAGGRGSGRPVSRNPYPVTPLPDSPEPEAPSSAPQTAPPEDEPRPKRASRKRNPALPIPDDWEPSELGRAYAIKRGMPIAEIEPQVCAMRNWHQAKGQNSANFDASWRTWCDRYRQYAPRSPANRGAGSGVNGRMTPADFFAMAQESLREQG